VRTELYLDFLDHRFLCRPEAKRTKSSQPPSGLIPNWEKTAPQKQTTTTGTTSSSIQTASLCANSEVDSVAAFGFGGIPSDDEKIERMALNEAGTQKDYSKYKYSTRYVPTFHDFHGLLSFLLPQVIYCTNLLPRSRMFMLHH
jgi:hypothetical protein